jgi:hypothetical protein
LGGFGGGGFNGLAAGGAGKFLWRGGIAHARTCPLPVTIHL